MIDGDTNINTCRTFDINNLPKIKEISFDFDYGSPSLIVGKLPDASANRLSFLLSKLYSKKLGIEEIDLNINNIDSSACTDWRFVFQNLSTGLNDMRRDTTSIPIFHGIVIIFDRKNIKHATTML